MYIFLQEPKPIEVNETFNASSNIIYNATYVDQLPIRYGSEIMECVISGSTSKLKQKLLTQDCAMLSLIYGNCDRR